ncbi:hypothetical protein KAJ27_12575 [bacterium]|nr:hypothetical protein [bacterium]
MSKKCCICNLNYSDSELEYCRKCGSKLLLNDMQTSWEFIFKSDVCGVSEMAGSLLNENGIQTQLSKFQECCDDIFFPSLLVDVEVIDKARNILRINGFI